MELDSSRSAPPCPGLSTLWLETLGDPRVCVAVLDDPIDRAHPSFHGADLELLHTLAPATEERGPALAHGTHVASVIFGQHGGLVRGIAPRCRGVIAPIFASAPQGTIAPCSQLDLARAITQAVERGAHII